MFFSEIVAFLKSYEIHLFLHFIAPGAVAWAVLRDRWRKAWGIMLLAMLVDLDHIMADPIFDPGRCSIDSNPLHSVPAIIGYLALAAFPSTRLAGLGLLIHMILDFSAC